MRARERWLAAAFVASAIPLAIVFPVESVTMGPPLGDLGVFEADGADDDATDEVSETPGVRVALDVDEPIVAGGSIVWTAAFQAAWDALRTQIGADDGLRVGPPAPPDVVRALNADRLAPGVVDARDLTLVAGPATDANWTLVDGVTEKPRPAMTRSTNSGDVVVAARLRASIRYAVPFAVHRRPLEFGPHDTPVRTYGIEEDTTGAIGRRLREQVVVHLPDADGETDRSDLAQRAVIVLKGGGGRRVVISGRRPRATLRATWADVAEVLATTAANSLYLFDRLEIPCVAIRGGRDFAELVGAPLEWKPGASIGAAREDVEFVANERGADVDASAVVVALGATSRHFVIDGPFLVALLAERSQQPFALAWIGGADGLVAPDAARGRALQPAERAPYVGSWTLDRRASVAASFAATNDAMPPGKPWWDAAGQRDFRTNAKAYFAARRFDLEVPASGEATVRFGPAEPPVVAASLRRLGRRTLLIHAETRAPSKYATDDVPAGPIEWRVRRAAGRLVLRWGSTVAVLRRR